MFANIAALIFGIGLLVMLYKHQNMKENYNKSLVYLTAVLAGVHVEYGSEAVQRLAKKGAEAIGVKINWVKK